ncbi:MAG: ABC transporter ATP-binding protein [Candidatus Bathyarchaeota archaeon]|nr:ABC transporter ATP-binding protein [Candidatus Bathyarchaeota archaeon]
MSSAIKMVGITKTFSSLVANDKINFELKKGEVHGLLGENGAGKTVLMSILYGLYKADEGQIFVNNKKVQISNPAKAIELGIGMVHQHFMLVPSLTVAENIILGREPKKNHFFLDIQTAEDCVKTLSNQYGLRVNPKAVVRNLPLGLQQRVEILKALFRGAEILILDEPTSVLTPQEVEGLFTAIKTLKRQNKSVIFISHKLKEICAICDRITVLKKGKVVGTVKAKETTQENLAEMMVGRQVFSTFRKKDLENGKAVLEVDKVKIFDDRKVLAVDAISFEVKEFEILGLAGIEGNGQTELVEALVGVRKLDSGQIYLNGKPIDNLSAHERIEKGIAKIPEDRQKRGLILDFSVSENLILGRHYKAPFSTTWWRLNSSEISAFSDELIKEYSIKTPDKDTSARHLSGGTQQRVVVAREFSADPIFIIASQPTRGLDVGATEYVRKKLVEMRNKGCAIFLVSADLDEIMTLSDRIAVIYEGKIVAVKNCNETNEFELGLLMTGGKND